MMIQNIPKVQTDDQDIKHNNSTNRRSGYNTIEQYKQTIGIQSITTVQTDDQDTTP
jgi:hypothetical protein